MSKAPRIKDYLEHMLSAIDRINRHIAGVERPKFLASERIEVNQILGSVGFGLNSPRAMANMRSRIRS